MPACNLQPTPPPSLAQRDQNRRIQPCFRTSAAVCGRRVRSWLSWYSVAGRMRKPIHLHDGSVTLRHTFGEAYAWLQSHPDAQLATAKGTAFTAGAAISRQREAIRFFQRRRNGTQGEYARAYACCWGHYFNCNRTRTGMYCEALDAAIEVRRQKSPTPAPESWASRASSREPLRGRLPATGAPHFGTRNNP